MTKKTREKGGKEGNYREMREEELSLPTAAQGGRKPH
jgi:hypothetical protein